MTLLHFLRKLRMWAVKTSLHDKLDTDAAISAAVERARLLILQKNHAAMRAVQNNIDDGVCAVGGHVQPGSLSDAQDRCSVLLVKLLHCA